MILLGCLLAFSAAVAPRIVLIFAWIFSDRWEAVWQGEWIWPLLGIIFLPYTTIMYLLAWNPAVAGGSSIEGWDWLWIILGLFLDIMKWGNMLANRREAQAQTVAYYPAGAPGAAALGVEEAEVASGQPVASTAPAVEEAEVDEAIEEQAKKDE